MTHTHHEHLELGVEITCADGPAGTLSRVVLDPTTETITHLVVTRHHGHEPQVLVPVELLASVDGELCLDCSIDELDSFPPARERHFVTGIPGPLQYRTDQILTWPYYTLSLGVGLSRGHPHDTRAVGGASDAIEGARYDRVPKGEVEVRRGDTVQALDGEIGRVRGLVVDLADDQVTHVLLEDGHLWGAREISIPIGAVSDARHGVRVALTRDQIRDLPTVRVHGLGRLSGAGPGDGS
jgi:sporulation protein YlmC with PRC-barrel domain